MSMFMAQAHRGFALGAKYGVLDGFRRFQTTTETPKMDETAMQGAIGIIIGVGRNVCDSIKRIVLFPIHFDDRYWRIQWPRYLNSRPNLALNLCRTLNTVATS